MRTFKIEFEGSLTLELASAVIEAVDDEWRSRFYTLHTPAEIAEHIAHNLFFNRWELSSLDGWTDQPDENAMIIDEDFYITSCEETEEANHA